MGFNIGDLHELQARLLASQETPVDPKPDPDPLPEPTPEAEPWMLPLFVGVIGAIVGVIIYSLLAPRFAAQEVNSMEEFVQTLYTIPALMPIAFTLPIVLYLTEVLKRMRMRFLPDWEWLSPYVIAVSLMLFCMGSFAVAEQYQYDNVFKEVAKVITQLIDVFGGYLLAALVGQVTVQVVHKKVRSVGVPGFDQ